MDNITLIDKKLEYNFLKMALRVKSVKNEVVKRQDYENASKLRDLELILFQVGEDRFDFKFERTQRTIAYEYAEKRKKEISNMEEKEISELTEEELIHYKILVIDIVISIKSSFENVSNILNKDDTKSVIDLTKDLLNVDPNLDILKSLSEEYPEIDWDDVVKSPLISYENVKRKLKIKLVLDN
jgi:hypothetical protein